MHPETFVTLGLLLGAALLFAAIIDIIRIPKVTAYLLLGMLVGPHGFGIVPSEFMHQLLPFERMAMALVLFNLGSRFPLARLRVLKRLLPLSLGEQLATFVLVGAGLSAVTGQAGISVLLGALALATAPATTVLVLKEIQARGSVTEFANGLVVLNNLTCILLFETLLLFVVGGQDVGSAAGHLLLKFCGALLLGLLFGIVVSYFSGLLTSKKWIVLLIAVSAGLLGLCDYAGMPYMLAFLTLGAVVASFSAEADPLVSEIDNVTTLLCVVFFLYHGTELDVRAFGAAGLLGVAYIILRCAGKYVGTWAMAKATHEPPDVQNWLGTTLLAQAGAAIALCSIAVERDAELGQTLQNIILGSVVFFEIVGPMCIRYGVIQAGEVPILHAIYHVGHTPLEQAKELWSRLCNAFAGELVHRPIEEMTVADIMQPSAAIAVGASFDHVIEHIEESHDDLFPVTDENGLPVGIIRYSVINSVLFDPHAIDLINAEDLMHPLEKTLLESDTAIAAIDYLTQSDDDIIAVVSAEEPHVFLGVVRRSEIALLLIQERKTSQNGTVEQAS